eukprot:scaffold10670_cov142-Isochrysis_galbana.AAC.6
MPTCRPGGASSEWGAQWEAVRGAYRGSQKQRFKSARVSNLLLGSNNNNNNKTKPARTTSSGNVLALHCPPNPARPPCKGPSRHQHSHTHGPSPHPKTTCTVAPVSTNKRCSSHRPTHRKHNPTCAAAPVPGKKLWPKRWSDM